MIPAASLSDRPASARQSRSAARKAVTGGMVPEPDDVTGLLAAEEPALARESLGHVAIADRCGDDPHAVLRHEAMEAEVRHHRHGDDVDAEREREDREDLVAVDDLAALVDREHAVAVSVERDSQVEATRARRAPASAARSVAPQPTLMFVPSGSVPIDVHLGAERGERLRRELREGAVRAVEADPEAGEVRAAPRDDAREVRVAAFFELVDGSAPGGAASSSASTSSSCSSTSFPPARKSLTPLYSGGLCEAEITIPSSSAR